MAELDIGVVHKGRALHGVIHSTGAFTGSAVFLLEDWFGGLVKVALYNRCSSAVEVKRIVDNPSSPTKPIILEY